MGVILSQDEVMANLIAAVEGLRRLSCKFDRRQQDDVGMHIRVSEIEKNAQRDRESTGASLNEFRGQMQRVMDAHKAEELENDRRFRNISATNAKLDAVFSRLTRLEQMTTFLDQERKDATGKHGVFTDRIRRLEEDARESQQDITDLDDSVVDLYAQMSPQDRDIELTPRGFVMRTLEQIDALDSSGVELTPIDRFIHTHEPEDDGMRKLFRDDLLDALLSVCK